jgi:hypothetical protein
MFCTGSEKFMGVIEPAVVTARLSPSAFPQPAVSSTSKAEFYRVTPTAFTASVRRKRRRRHVFSGPSLFETGRISLRKPLPSCALMGERKNAHAQIPTSRNHQIAPNEP